MKKNKKDIQIGTQTNNNGQEGAEFIEQISTGNAKVKKMTKGEKRACKKMFKDLLEKSKITQEQYDDFIAELDTK